MPSIKTISAGGQISLGKKYAGRTVIIESPEEGVWVVKAATVIPDNERWLHEEPAKSKLEAAIAWAATHEPQETNWEEFEAKVQAVLEARETVSR